MSKHDYIYSEVDDLINAVYKYVAETGDLICTSDVEISSSSLAYLDRISIELHTKHRKFSINKYPRMYSLLFNRILSLNLTIEDYQNNN